MNDMIAFFADEYNEEHWNSYANCFPEADLQISEIPQDIVNAVVGVLGEIAYKWLTDTPFRQFNGMKAVEVLQMPNGEKALKAFVMRLPC